jgi:hypothetical protein
MIIVRRRRFPAGSPIHAGRDAASSLASSWSGKVNSFRRRTRSRKLMISPAMPKPMANAKVPYKITVCAPGLTPLKESHIARKARNPPIESSQLPFIPFLAAEQTARRIVLEKDPVRQDVAAAMGGSLISRRLRQRLDHLRHGLKIRMRQEIARIPKRRGWDSNPRGLSSCRFSRPVRSAALPPLRLAFHHTERRRRLKEFTPSLADNSQRRRSTQPAQVPQEHSAVAAAGQHRAVRTEA